MRTRNARRRSAIAGAIAMACGGVVQAAAPNFNSGSITIVHDLDVGDPSTIATRYHSVTPVVTTSMPGSFQLNDTAGATLSKSNGVSTLSSTATASVARVENSTTATITLAAGTGISQTDTNHNSVGASSLRININNYDWTPNTNFGPPATGYFSVTVGGVVGSGGSVQFNGSLTFTNQSGALLCSTLLLPVSPNPNPYIRTIVGPFTQSFTASALFSPSVLSNTTHIKLSGFLDLRATQDDPSSFDPPFVIDMGSAPPTATWTTKNPAGNWGDETNWAPIDPINQGDPDNVIPLVPNSTGVRARFAGPGATPTVNLNIPITIGTLDVDQPDANPLTINGANTLTFDVNNSAIFTTQSAVLEHRNVQGNSALTVNAPVHLNSPLEANIHSSGGVVINGNMTGNALTKNGAGQMTVQNAQLQSITVNEGTFAVGAGGSLGQTPINVNSGAALNVSALAGGYDIVNQVIGGGAGAAGGTIYGGVHLSGGGVVDPNGAASPGTLNFNDNFQFNGGSLRFDLSNQTNAGNDHVNVGGNLDVINGTIEISAIGSLTTGTYQLLNYGNVSGSPAAILLKNNTRAVMALDGSTPGIIKLNVNNVGPVTLLNWNGNGSAVWDVNSTTNWTNTGTFVPDKFFTGDGVNFNDNTANSNVVLNTNVAPRTWSINNTAGHDYSFSGTGGIFGPTGLTKAGAGVLVLGMANSYSGATQVQGGVLRLNSIGALPSGADVTLGGGGAAALDLNGYYARLSGLHTSGGGVNVIGNSSTVSNSVLTFAGGNSSYGGMIVDSLGAGTKKVSLIVASGSLGLSGNNTYTGGTNVEKTATVVAGHAHALGSGPVYVAGTGALKFAAGLGAPIQLARLDIDDGGVVDMMNNSMAIDFDGTGTLVEDFRRNLQSGRLFTSLASSTRTLGFGDNNILHRPTLAGESVDDTSLLVKFTYPADFTLNGQVDLDDLVALSLHWQQAGTWITGDGNYDGTINLSDLVLLANNWQNGVGNPLGPTSLQDALASVGLGDVAVPEPSAMLLALGAPMLLRRRRR